MTAISLIRYEGDGVSATPLVQSESGTIAIGRETENDLVLDDTSVSRRHGAITQFAREWIYRDLGSTNGSTVNELPIHQAEMKILRHGDKLGIADAFFRVRVSSDENDSPRPMLLIFMGDMFQSEFPFPKWNSVFSCGGPESKLDIQGISDATGSTSMTPELFRIALTGDTLELQLLDPQLPVFLGARNGQKLTSSTTLADRDELIVGPYRLLVSAPLAPTRKVEPVLPAQPFTVQQSTVQPGQRTKTEVNIFSAQDAASRASQVSTVNPQPSNWEDDLSKKRASSSRKFIFAGDQEIDPSKTISLSGREARSKMGGSGGFEMNVSHRFQSMKPTPDDESKKAFGRTIVTLGIVLLALFLTFLLFVIIKLQT